MRALPEEGTLAGRSIADGGRKASAEIAQPVVEIAQLTVAYGSRVVLDAFSLRIEAGQAVALRGSNGAGKSTLLRCVAGLHAPHSGVLLVGGRHPDDRDRRFRRVTAALLDNAAWYSTLSATEHLELVQRANAPLPDDWFSAAELTNRLDLLSFADLSPTRLSSGQRQRLALAMVFARPSALLLIDEPERHLDEAGRRAVAELISAYVTRGGAVLVATHEPVVATACDVVNLDRATR